MKTIVFATLQKGTQGSYLNHLDLQQHLKDNEGYRIKFYCENVKKLFEVIKDSRRKYTFKKGEIKLFRKEVIELETVITDFKTLIMLKELDKKIICEKLLILDAVELTYHLKGIKHAKFFYDVNVHDCLTYVFANEIQFLMPPSNHKLFQEKYPDLNSKPFFKRINIDVLNTIEHKDITGYFFRWDIIDDYKEKIKEKFGDNCFVFEPDWTKNINGVVVPLKYNEAEHLFDYKNFLYRRRKYLEYQEQFGRLIFEYILLGKTVYFFCEPFTDDCLTDYLRYYNIKFDKNNMVVTSKNELETLMKTYNDKPWE